MDTPTYSIENGQIVSTTQTTITLADLQRQSDSLGSVIATTQAQKDAVDAIIAQAQAAGVAS